MSVQFEKPLINGQRFTVIQMTGTGRRISRFWFVSVKLTGDKEIIDTLQQVHGGQCMLHNHTTTFQNSVLK